MRKKHATVTNRLDGLFLDMLAKSKTLEKIKPSESTSEAEAALSEAEAALALAATRLEEAVSQAEAEGANMATTARVKLALLEHWGSILDVPGNEGAPIISLPPRPFDPDTAFETIRFRKGRRPADDATTTGDAARSRTRASRHVRGGSPSLRQLCSHYRIIFRSYQVVKRKERLFHFNDPTVPAREAALHAAREALFERVTRTGHRRRS